jgi:hypothetical protein
MPAIGSMVIKPGDSTLVSMDYLMHDEMGGKHDFRLILRTNDPAEPIKEVQVLSNWVP